ncbi:hypothetical protein FRX31_014604 [Thalictrum thalictroides]|uniref:Uncharacterized protein n=1 Tax=Thalictrum thalictroides TaxID=46969 RepID=A0A7J6WEM4_THATH|nr:hypothetical protein FRX31_014604 [Thalictrum thalictroides]
MVPPPPRQPKKKASKKTNNKRKNDSTTTSKKNAATTSKKNATTTSKKTGKAPKRQIRKKRVNKAPGGHGVLNLPNGEKYIRMGTRRGQYIPPPPPSQDEIMMDKGPLGSQSSTLILTQESAALRRSPWKRNKPEEPSTQESSLRRSSRIEESASVSKDPKGKAPLTSKPPLSTKKNNLKHLVAKIEFI